MDEHIPSIENKVMGEIASGRVKLRSRYIFWAEKFGLRSVLLFTVLLAVLFFSLVFYYLKASDNLEYLSFGKSGLFAFLESFPYLLVAMVVVCILVAGIILKKSGLFYKQPIGYLAIGLVGFTLVAGAALALTSVDEAIEQETYSQRVTGVVFRPFFAQEERQRGIAGRIVHIENGSITVQTPHGTRTLIVDATLAPILTQATVGDYLIAIGSLSGNVFHVDQLRVASPDAMPVIRRGIHHQFGEPRDGPPSSGGMLHTTTTTHCFAACSPGNLCGQVCER